MRRINDAQANPMPPSNQALRKAMERDEAAGTNVVVRDQRAAALVLTVATTDDPETIVREVSLLWNHAQQSFLAIGRYLLQGRRSIAKRLQHESPNMGEAERRSTVYGEYRRLILAKLPFGPKVANQL